MADRKELDQQRRLLLMHEYFYHVTDLANLNSIREDGLSPSFSDPTMYEQYFEEPAIFLCTEDALPQAKQMFDTELQECRLVVIRIPSAAVVEHKCDVDHSFPDKTKGLTFGQCLEQVGFFACYGGIPPEYVEVYESQDTTWHWQRGDTIRE